MIKIINLSKIHSVANATYGRPDLDIKASLYHCRIEDDGSISIPFKNNVKWLRCMHTVRLLLSEEKDFRCRDNNAHCMHFLQRMK
jgi:hypothetical protein